MDPKHSESYINKGSSLDNLKRYGEAEKAFDEAVTLQRSVFRSWLSMVCGVDANSPGILTMASNPIIFLETSAVTATNISQVFTQVASQINRKISSKIIDPSIEVCTDDFRNSE